jgi:hypothetical protein
MIPQSILDYIKETISGTHHLSDGAIVEKKENVSTIIDSLIEGTTVQGIGVSTKRNPIGIKNKDAGKDKTIIEFAISDGENSADCIIHNTASKYLAGGLDNTTFGTYDKMLRVSIAEGKPIKIEGAFTNLNRKRLFVVEDMQYADDNSKSQLSEEQITAFLDLCKTENIEPLDILTDDDSIWSEFYADNSLKEAVMLFCLSPYDKNDMIHFGLITNPGEGKNHLVDKVIAPLVRCRMAGTGKLSTFAALFGAMSSDDLSSIELGMLPKMHNSRIVFSEFQTMDEDVFGEMLNVMSDGFYSLQKGKMDVTRHAMLNMGFFGNPPNYWGGEDSKIEMLAAFGKYTLPIISRLTIIFAKPVLNDDPNAEEKIRMKILENMDKKSKSKTKNNELAIVRQFFKEYLLHVSKLEPQLGLFRSIIQSEFVRIQETENFKEAFATRSKTDNRKWAGFLSLIRGYARLNGRDKLLPKDVTAGSKMFCESLETLTGMLPKSSLLQGVDFEMLELHRQMLSEFDKGMGQGCTVNKKKAKAFAKKQNRNKQFYELLKIKLDNKTMLIEDLGNGEILIKRDWEGSL